MYHIIFGRPLLPLVGLLFLLCGCKEATSTREPKLSGQAAMLRAENLVESGNSLLPTQPSAAIDNYLAAAVLYREADRLAAYKNFLSSVMDTIDRYEIDIQESLRLLEDVNNLPHRTSNYVSFCYGLLGYYLQFTENYLQRLASYETAYRLQPKQDRKEDVRPAINYAKNLIRLGDDRKAVSIFNQAADIVASPDYDYKEDGVSLNLDLSIAYWDMGIDYVAPGLKAVKAGRRYLPAIGNDKKRRDLSIRLFLSEAKLLILSKRYQEARRVVNKAMSISTAGTDFAAELVGSRLAVLADLNRESGQYSKSLTLINQAIDTARMSHVPGAIDRELAKLYLFRAQAQRDNRNAAAAAADLQQCLKYLLPSNSTGNMYEGSLYAENTLTDAYYELAQTKLTQFDEYSNPEYLAAALRSFSTMQRAEDILLDRLSYSNAQLHRLADNRGRLIDYVDAIRRSEVLGNSHQSDVFGLMQESRAYLLRNEYDVDRFTGGDGVNQRVLLRRFYALTDSIELKRRDLQQSGLSTTERDRLTDEEYWLYQSREQLEEVLSEVTVGLQRSIKPSVELATFQRQLDRNELHLFFLERDSATYYLQAVTQQSQELVTVQLAPGVLSELIQLISAPNRSILDRDRSSNQRYLMLASEVYQRLFTDLSVDPTTFSSITVYPDGDLFRLPFAALVSKEQTLAQYIDGPSGMLTEDVPYLLQSASITYAHAILPKRSVQSGGEGLLTLLPNYECCQLTDYAGKQTLAATTQQQRGKVYVGQQLSVDQTVWREQLFKARSIVYYGHFVADLSDPLSGYFALTCSGSTCDRYQWPIRALLSGQSLDLDYFLVAGCESGRGVPIPGEGLDNLERLLLAKGVQNVISAQWPIDQTATALLVNHFMTAQQSQHVNQAARLAVRQLIENNPYYSHPYYWAGLRLAARN